MLQHCPVITADRCLIVMSHNSTTFPAVQVWQQVLLWHAVQFKVWVTNDLILFLKLTVYFSKYNVFPSLFLQVSDAQLAAVRGQGLDPVLPSAPFLYFPLCQCVTEAGVSPAGHQPRDPAPVGQQPAAFQCSNSLPNAAAGHCAVRSVDLVLGPGSSSLSTLPSLSRLHSWSSHVAFELFQGMSFWQYLFWQVVSQGLTVSVTSASLSLL